jgi:GST-like protein
MIYLYTWRTPNGFKVPIMLEECQLAYKIIPIDISKNAQFEQQFLQISPNNKIPAIVDHANQSISVFESGAILIYLAERTAKFMPTELNARIKVIEWLMFQMSGLGPTFGQLFHFKKSAPENIPYAIERYTKESIRLLTIINKQLAKEQYIAGDYSIADMALYPWLKAIKSILSDEMKDLPYLVNWLDLVGNRKAVKDAMNITI